MVCQLSSMSNITGRLFPDTPEGQTADLSQSVRDRIMTIPGSQAWRPGYGSVIPQGATGGTSFDEGISSINNVLLTGPYREPRVFAVRFERNGVDLVVWINRDSFGLGL